MVYIVLGTTEDVSGYIAQIVHVAIGRGTFWFVGLVLDVAE